MAANSRQAIRADNLAKEANCLVMFTFRFRDYDERANIVSGFSGLLRLNS